MSTPKITQVVQGGARLTFDAISGITHTVERMHETIARHPLPWSAQPDRPSRAHGVIASGVYAGIRGVNGMIGAAVDHSIGLVPDAAVSETQLGRGAMRTIAALNGAFGDHLEATDNPLAIGMCLMTPEEKLPMDPGELAAAVPQASPHVVVLVHGLSLSESSWRRNSAACIGRRLQEEQDITPLYLRYNTGRHISTNGQEFARQLEQLCAAWPVPVESLSLIGHSMGGLVIRSACWYADQWKSDWLAQLKRVVCLGTPHHGSAVAKAGHSLNVAMQRIPYTAPLAFGERRSAGIKDLRHGDLLDEHWRDYHPGETGSDTRQLVPLLSHVEYYFAAATLGRHRQDPLGRVLGDLLVRLGSATGSHEDDLRHLSVKAENCRVFHEKNHFDLLDDERVQQQVLAWFSAG